jgi:L-amino acid N-acyltransferase YncA
VNIRPATPADARAVAEVLFSLEEHPSYRQHGLVDLENRVRTGLRMESSNRSVLVAELEGLVMGYGAVQWFTPVMSAPEGYVSDLFVHAKRTGRGLGSSLLEALTVEAKTRGCRRLALSNWRNRRSYQRGFYAKRGWQENIDSARFVLDLEMIA